jgi:PEP-CTERM motif
MIRTRAKLAISVALIGLLPAVAAAAETPFLFDTGAPDGKIATAARPDSAGKFEIESADDFVLTTTTSINSATFTGLLTGDGSVSNVRVEIYRVFPNDSDVGRTSGPPTFTTPQVPTRVNSPSDVAFLDTDSASGGLRFTTDELAATFTASNSVQPGGIHSKPGQTTGGNGAVTGEEVRFDLSFTHGLLLPANHYFFVPQVEVTDPDGNFFWLSAPKPIVSPGTPFPPGATDLQSWTRDAALDPDWLRVGTDIVGGATPPTFNAAFSLTGAVVPEPSTWAMMLLGFAGLGFAAYRKSRSVISTA